MFPLPLAGPGVSVFPTGGSFRALPKTLAIPRSGIRSLPPLRFEGAGGAGSPPNEKNKGDRQSVVRLRFTVGDCLVSIICRRRGCDSRMALPSARQPARLCISILSSVYVHLPKPPVTFPIRPGENVRDTARRRVALKDTKHSGRRLNPSIPSPSSRGSRRRTKTLLLIGRVCSCRT